MTEGEAGHLSDAAGTPDTSIPVGRWLMAAVLVSLNLVDVLLTRAILAAGGSESNPIMQPVIRNAYVPVLIKVGLAGLVGVLLLASPRRSKLADRAVLATVVLYALVIAWNGGLLLHTTLG